MDAPAPPLLGQLRALLRAQWRLVTAFFLAAALVSLGYVRVAAPSYASSWTMRVGSVVGLGAIDRPGHVAARVRQWLRDQPGGAACRCATSFLEAPDSIVELTVWCADPDLAVRLATGAANLVLDRQATAFRQEDPRRAGDPQLLTSVARFDTAMGRLMWQSFLATDEARKDNVRRGTKQKPEFVNMTQPTSILQPPRRAVTPAWPGPIVPVAGAACGLLAGLLVAALRMSAQRHRT